MEGTEKTKRSAGFTLVEIMIVVSIIGVLSAVAIPSFQSVRSKSLKTAMNKNVKLVDNAVEMWAMDKLVLDGTLIDASITNYIKGGFSTLAVGSTYPDLTNITAQTVGHVFTAADLY